jgi:molecular chaperone GrpE
MTGQGPTSADTADGETAEPRPEEPQPAEEAPPPTEELIPRAEAVLLEDRLRRALADLDNLRKRYAREMGRERQDERAQVAAQWLPVVDDLDRALEHATADASALFEGVEAIRDHAATILARLGFPRFDEVGVPFDPLRHQAVGTIETNGTTSPGTVAAVVRPGYGTEEAILRPASVVVVVVAREPG